MAKKDKAAPAETETETPVEQTAAPAEEKATKSIVPRGWKSKKDELKQFIDEQSSGKEGFEFTAFFALMRKNGVPEEKVAHYETQVAEKRPGANGRAIMTLRNMLVPLIRKNGKVVALDGTEVAMDIPKPAPSGAAAKAKQAAADKEQAAA